MKKQSTSQDVIIHLITEILLISFYCQERTSLFSPMKQGFIQIGRIFPGMFFFCFLFLFAKIESKRLYFSKIEGQVSFGQIPHILQTKCFKKTLK